MQATDTAAPQLYLVTAGPYKNHMGRKVDGAQVRGRVGWDYIESEYDGQVYEVRPAHLAKCKRL